MSSNKKRKICCRIIIFLCRVTFIPVLIGNFQWSLICALEYYDEFDMYIGAITPMLCLTIFVGLIIYIIHAKAMRMLIALEEILGGKEL